MEVKEKREREKERISELIELNPELIEVFKEAQEELELERDMEINEVIRSNPKLLESYLKAFDSYLENFARNHPATCMVSRGLLACVRGDPGINREEFLRRFPILNPTPPKKKRFFSKRRKSVIKEGKCRNGAI